MSHIPKILQDLISKYETDNFKPYVDIDTTRKGSGKYILRFPCRKIVEDRDVTIIEFDNSKTKGNEEQITHYKVRNYATLLNVLEYGDPDFADDYKKWSIEYTQGQFKKGFWEAKGMLVSDVVHKILKNCQEACELLSDYDIDESSSEDYSRSSSDTVKNKQRFLYLMAYETNILLTQHSIVKGLKANVGDTTHENVYDRFKDKEYVSKNCSGDPIVVMTWEIEGRDHDIRPFLLTQTYDVSLDISLWHNQKEFYNFKNDSGNGEVAIRCVEKALKDSGINFSRYKSWINPLSGEKNEF